MGGVLCIHIRNPNAMIAAIMTNPFASEFIQFILPFIFPSKVLPRTTLGAFVRSHVNAPEPEHALFIYHHTLTYGKP